MFSTKLGLAIVLVGLVPIPAFAETDCTGAKDLVNMVQSFYQADSDRVDIIKPEFNLQLKPIGDNPAPSGLRYIYEGLSVDLLVDEDGNVQDMEKAVSFDKAGELCKLVEGKPTEKSEEPTVQANMSFGFPFIKTSGSHSVADLIEGAKDGSKIMNTLAPGGLGFMVPSLKAIIVSPVDKDGETPVLRFMDGQNLTRGPKITTVKKNQLFKIKDLKKSNVDRLEISGPYRLIASFDFDEEEIKQEAEE